MLSIFKVESYIHWILFSLHEDIIEPYSLWFPSKDAPTTFEQKFQVSSFKFQFHLNNNISLAAFTILFATKKF